MEKVNNPLFSTKLTFVEKNENCTVYDVKNSETEEMIASVKFQDGAIKETGINGIFNEDLLLMIIDRLENFQKSKFACNENEQALIKLEEAVMWLRKRTTEREVRGVAGTHVV